MKILITGASGFVGFHTLVLALREGHSVRAAVRTEAKARILADHPVIAALQPEARLEVILVADMCAPGAFTKAVEGDIEAIVHTASPLPSAADWDRGLHLSLIRPCVEGTRQVLLAAARTPRINRIVFTSSVAVNVPWHVLDRGDASGRVWTPHDRIPVLEPPYGNASQAYSAGKVLALRLIEEWMLEADPHFTVANIMAGFIIGRDLLARDLKSLLATTNGDGLDHVRGGVRSDPGSPVSCDVEDVALAHLRALCLQTPFGQRVASFGVGVRAVWDDACEIVRREFPLSIRNGLLPANGRRPSVEVAYDVADTERILGFRLKSFDEQVVGVVQQFIDLAHQQNHYG